MRAAFFRFFVLMALTGLVAVSSAQSGKADSKDVATVDGGIGPCSIELTVNGADGKPIYGASVKVHIAYGFGGFHKLDLEAATNTDGKVNFTGLPNRVRRPPLEFDGSKDELAGTVNYDPAVQCRAKQAMVLEKPKPAAENQQ